MEISSRCDSASRFVKIILRTKQSLLSDVLRIGTLGKACFSTLQFSLSMEAGGWGWGSVCMNRKSKWAGLFFPRGFAKSLFKTGYEAESRSRGQGLGMALGIEGWGRIHSAPSQPRDVKQGDTNCSRTWFTPIHRPMRISKSNSACESL